MSHSTLLRLANTGNPRPLQPPIQFLDRAQKPTEDKKNGIHHDLQILLFAAFDSKVSKFSQDAGVLVPKEIVLDLDVRPRAACCKVSSSPGCR